MRRDDRFINHLTSEQLLKISETIRSNFSERLTGVDPELVILPVDPYHLHAYWNLGDQSTTSLLSENSNKLVLRFYWDSKWSSANCYFNVNINSTLSRRNIRLPADDSCYVGVIGLLDGNQNLKVLVKSNSVHVPRANSLPETETPPITELAQSIAAKTRRLEVNDATRQQYYDEDLIHYTILKIMSTTGTEDNKGRLEDLLQVEKNINESDVKQEKFDEAAIDQLIRLTLKQTSEATLSTEITSIREQNFAVSNHSGKNFHF